MTPEQMEMAITEYLDGTLPAERVAALEEVLANDSEARVTLEQHRRLTALLRAEPLPEMNWGELGKDFAAVVTGTVDEGSRAADQRLNAVIKAMPAVPAVRWDALAREISGSIDRELEATGADDEKLDGLLRSTPLPALNWDRLASHLSERVAEAAGVEEQEAAREAVVYRMPWVRTAVRVAVAACVVVAGAVGVRHVMNRPAAGPTGPQVVATGPANPGAPVAPGAGSTAVVVVSGPSVEAAAGKAAAVAEVSIGPSSAYAANSDEEWQRRGVSNRPQVVIAFPVGQADDTEHVLAFE